MLQTTAVKVKGADLSEVITQHVEELISQTDKAAASKEFTAWLDAMSKFHHYSAGNVFMILLTMPTATHVAGFHRWLELNRFVRRGEHGIPILCPCIHKEKNDQGSDVSVLAGFKVGYVFDISQTDGEPLPELTWHETTCDQDLQNKLTAFAHSKSIKVEYSDDLGEAQGSSGGGIIKLAPGSSNATFIHELAHELLHQVKTEHYTRKQAELEAESVAYVVCKHLGIENTSASVYLAVYDATSKDIMQSLNRIQKAAHEIINYFNPEPTEKENHG